MKKSFLYLFTVLCTLSFFTACSDDDDPKDPNVLDVNASYSGDKLSLKYSDEMLLGKEISFDTKDGKTATITMKGTFDMSSITDLIGGGSKANFIPSLAPGVIPGETVTTLNNVALTLSGETYTFEGTDESNGRTVKYTGEVKKDMLTMAVNVTMPTNPLTEGKLWKMTGSVFAWKSSEKLPIGDGGWETENAAALLNQMFISPELMKVLADVTFLPDGNVVATYGKDGLKSPINLANYYIKSSKLYVTLNIDMIIMTATKANNADLMELVTALLQTPLMGALSEGFPLNYTVENGVATISLDQEFILPILKVLLSSKYVTDMIGELIASNPDMAAMAPMIQAILGELPAVLEGTTELTFGLTLQK
ncbi:MULTISPECIES: DUF4925 domain-containing protein [Parabacteroides]|uniref:DUF4925 domain-containing protein n=1 Tax=Parabacteroides TaxID=375288 RepID=UPI000EFF2FD1|nr:MULTISPECIES: DUF4925 domain-containing protein [Parabacteroides]RHU30406.1 DUF4925 domain-containing protein [Parabacteroides sp. TM07-1AC]WFE83734.1 DUF4925 domain-containing protein [Parabacteroides chongii]